MTIHHIQFLQPQNKLVLDTFSLPDRKEVKIGRHSGRPEMDLLAHLATVHLDAVVEDPSEPPATVHLAGVVEDAVVPPDLHNTETTPSAKNGPK